MTSVNPGAEPREAGVENATLNNSPGRRNQTPMAEEAIVNIASMQPSFGEGAQYLPAVD